MNPTFAVEPEAPSMNWQAGHRACAGDETRPGKRRP